MKITQIVSGFVALGVWTAGAVQAQNGVPSTPVIQPPQSISPNTTPALPFVYTAPLPPVELPPVGSPIKPFVESPVGPYGHLTPPITTPAAPVVGTRSTPLVPNGVLLSNGAIVDPNSVNVLSQPIMNGLSLESMKIQSTFQTVDGPIESRLNGGPRDQLKVLGPASTGTELVPTPPSPLIPPTSNSDSGRQRSSSTNTRPTLPRAGASYAEVIDALGSPVMSVIQNGSQILYFNDGTQVSMKDGVVVR